MILWEGREGIVKSSNLELLVSQLAGASDWLSAGELAVLLQTTTRTVRNYVRDLNAGAGNVPLVISGVKGYRWNAEVDNLREMYQIARVQPQTPLERELYILRKLLYNQSSGLTQLSEELMVSERTIQLDLEQIRSLLRRYHLSLRQRREVIRVHGMEVDKRRLSYYCIEQTCKTRLFTLKFLEYVFPQFDIPALDNLVQDALENHQLSLNAYCRYDLLLLLLIQVNRMEHGEYLSNHELPVSELEESPDYAAAQRITSALGDQYHLEYTSLEVEYAAALILSKADYWGDSSFLEKTVYWMLPKQIEYELDTLHRSMSIDFTGEEMSAQLVHFFHRMIVRGLMSLPTFNPLANVLRVSEPNLYNSAAWIMAQFISLYQIKPDDGEVGFLTLKLWELVESGRHMDKPITYTLVCPQLGTLSQRLVRTLDTKFGPRLRPGHIINTVDVENIPASDMCLSVLLLENKRRLIHISPLLSEANCEAIRREIGRIDRMRCRDFLTAYLTCYAQSDFFERDHTFSTMEDAVHYMCQRLNAQSCVDETFEKIILQRENASSTAFFQLVALPHACGTCVKRNSLYIILNRSPMPWERGSVNLVVLMALERGLMEDFKFIYQLFIKIFAHPSNLTAVLQAKDLFSFIEIISKISID